MTYVNAENKKLTDGSDAEAEAAQDASSDAE